MFIEIRGEKDIHFFRDFQEGELLLAEFSGGFYVRGGVISGEVITFQAGESSVGGNSQTEGLSGGRGRLGLFTII